MSRAFNFMFLSVALVLMAGCDSTSPASENVDVHYVVEGAPAAITFVDEDGLADIQTDGSWEHTFTASTSREFGFRATSLTGDLLTGSIFVDNRLARTERAIHVDLRFTPSDSTNSEVEVRGFIEARTQSSVTVLGTTFRVDEQTVLLDNRNNPIDYSAFVLGTFVEAEGRAISSGNYLATKLKLEDGDDEIEVHGRIEEINGSSFRVNGILFVVNDQTEFLDDENNPISFDQFRLNDLVEAEGYEGGNGEYVAEKIKLDDD